MGRPTDCTPELTETLCAELKLGMSIRQACRHVGLDDSTYRRWIMRGAEGEEPFATFCTKATQARADGTRALVVTVRKAAASDWRAAAWILERREPDDWSKRTEISGPDGGPVQVQSLAAEIAAQLATTADKDLGIPDDL